MRHTPDETIAVLVEALKDCVLYLDALQFGPDSDAPWDGNIREIIHNALKKAEEG